MSLEQYEMHIEFKNSEKAQIFSAINKENNEKVVVKKYFYETEINKFQPLVKNRHKNIANILEYGKYENGFYLVEEFIDGATIEEMLLGGKIFTQKEVYKISLQICSALNHLHEFNIIYRDLKPANIMITIEDTIKLIDFNTIRIYNLHGDKDTQHLGTIGYAPPEQYGFSQTDFRSDIYSFGVTLGAITRSSRVYGSIIKKCINVDSDKRYKNIDELLKAIKLSQIKSNPVFMPLVAFAIIIVCFITTKTIEYINFSVFEDNVKHIAGSAVEEEKQSTEYVVDEGEIQPIEDSVVEEETQPTEDAIAEAEMQLIEDTISEKDTEPKENIVIENEMQHTENGIVKEEEVAKKGFPNLIECEISQSGFEALRLDEAVNATLREILGDYYYMLMDNSYTGKANSIYKGVDNYTVLTPFSAWEIWQNGNIRITWIRYNEYPYFTKQVFTTPNFNDETAYSQQWLAQLYKDAEEINSLYDQMKEYME